MQGRTYEVFADGKPVGLVGSTINTLIQRRRNGYIKRFGPTVELRLLREVLYPDGYTDDEYNFYLKACEAMDISRKKTYQENGGLNKISPLIQALGHPMLESAMGKIGGRKAVESGQLASIQTSENQLKGLKNRPREQFVKAGILGGKRRCELHGSPQTKQGSVYGCRKRNRIHGNPATFESCSKAGKIGVRNQPWEAKSYGGQKINHIRWDEKRHRPNPKCKICQILAAVLGFYLVALSGTKDIAIAS